MRNIVSSSNFLDNLPIRCNEGAEELITTDDRPSSFLDFAKIVYYGRFADRIVDDVKLFRNTLIIFIIGLPYWLVTRQVKRIKFQYILHRIFIFFSFM